MMGSKTDDIINELFESLWQNYQKGLEEKVRRSEFIFDTNDLLYCHLEKISLKRGGSYIDSPKWLKNKKATINPKNNDDDDNCSFKYSVFVVAHWEEIDNHPERISNLTDFSQNYNWKDIDFPATSKDWKNLNKAIRQLLLIPYLYHTILNK